MRLRGDERPATSSMARSSGSTDNVGRAPGMIRISKSTKSKLRPRITPGRSQSKSTPTKKKDNGKRTLEPQQEENNNERTNSKMAARSLFWSIPMAPRVDGVSQLTALLGSAELKVREQLLVASEKGKKHAVYLLLHQGISPERCRGMRGFTPLHHAATRGHLDVLQLLLTFGWPVNITNDSQETALHVACYNGHAAVVECLLDKGAAINALTEDSETPLFYAARKHHDRVVRLLIRYECDLTIKNRFGDLAEDEATQEKTREEFAIGQQDRERLYQGRPHGGSHRPTTASSGEEKIAQPQRELVLSFLDLTSLCHASQVSYRWHRAADNPVLWRQLGISRWELLLQTTMGIGAVSPMSTMKIGSGLQLNVASMMGSSRRSRDSTGPRRPSSCDLGSGGGRILAPPHSVTRARQENSGGSSRTFLLGSTARRPQTARLPDW